MFNANSTKEIDIKYTGNDYWIPDLIYECMADFHAGVCNMRRRWYILLMLSITTLECYLFIIVSEYQYCTLRIE